MSHISTCERTFNGSKFIIEKKNSFVLFQAIKKVEKKFFKRKLLIKI